jgi:hypothetical protein
MLFMPGRFNFLLDEIKQNLDGKMVGETQKLV